jgi:hypothetical protein
LDEIGFVFGWAVGSLGAEAAIANKPRKEKSARAYIFKAEAENIKN